jgi:glycosyltransferase involved in cell wall biosynthesis
MSMKVAVLGIKTMPAYAGADRVVERVLEQLPDEAFTIYLVRGGPKLTCTSTRHYVYVPTLKGKHLRAFSFFVLSTLHFLAKGDADVVHVHNSDFGLFCPLLKLKRRPIVGTFHGDPYLRAKWGLGARTFLRLSEWVFIRTCDVLTSVSAVEKGGVAEILHIPNGVHAEDSGDESPDALLAARFGLGPYEYVLFACGRLDSTKGLHHLLDAYRGLSITQRLLVVGDFSHDARYTEAIRDAAALDDRVILYPELLDRQALYDTLRGAAVFVFPSEVEAMSMMLLEAIASRTLVVCSDIAENGAVVGDGYPMLFRSGDPDSLREVLLTAMSLTQDEREQLTADLADVASAFDWSTIAARYESLYVELVPATGAELAFER